MPLTYITITGTEADGTGAPLNADVTLTPSQAVYAASGPVVVPAVPVLASFTGGTLVGPSGGPLQLLANAQAGLTLMSGTGFWWWTASVRNGNTVDSWSFQLATTPASVDLYSTKNTPAQGGTSFTGGTLGQYIAPAVATLTDGASVPLNAALGNDFRWTLGGSSHTLAAPTNAVNGQAITIAIKYTGSFTPLFAAAYDFGTSGQPSWTAASGRTDYVGFRYDSALNGNAGAWAYQGFQPGFTS